MKAAFIEELGSPDVIQVDDLPRPMMHDDDVLVKVQAAAVDPIDTYIRRGLYKTQVPFPFIIGRDMIGVVAEIGSDVTRFKVGDRVWCNNQGYAGRQGTFAEYIAVEEGFLYQLPDGIDATNVLASAHSALTSVLALIGKAKLKSHETIFINGGSGNVGTCATQLAKSIGARVIVTAGSPDKANYCRDCGADEIINYKNEDVQAAVKRIVPHGVDVYWDLSPTPDVQLGLNLTARRGRILLSSGMQHTSSFNVGDFYQRNCTMYGFTISDLTEGELSEYAEIIISRLKRNTFKTRIARTMALSQAALAHQLVESGEVGGKIIVEIA